MVNFCAAPFFCDAEAGFLAAFFLGAAAASAPAALAGAGAEALAGAAAAAGAFLAAVLIWKIGVFREIQLDTLLLPAFGSFFFRMTHALEVTQTIAMELQGA